MCKNQKIIKKFIFLLLIISSFIGSAIADNGSSNLKSKRTINDLVYMPGKKDLFMQLNYLGEHIF